MFGVYQQRLNPFGDSVLWSPVWSTMLAALPVVVLFWLLVPRRWLAPKAGAAGALTAIVIAIIIYQMPANMAVMAFIHGAAFGLMPVGWTIFNAMLLYNCTVETGQFSIVRRSVAGLSADARIQAILIGFAFGAFLEGAAGGGTPVAICGAIMVGLGFHPFLAAVLCLIANTSPVAYGGLGTPLIVLGNVTGLPTETLSVMAGHQLPFLSVLVPLYMVKVMCSWKQTWAVWPALLVSGGSFAIFQYTFATGHTWGLPVLYPMTDIGGGIFSLVVTAIFLKFWKPRDEWHFDKASRERERPEEASAGAWSGDHAPAPDTPPPVAHAPGSPGHKGNGHAAEAAALVGPDSGSGKLDCEPPLTIRSVSLAWAPYVLMSVLLLLTGLVRQKEGHGPVHIGPIQTSYKIPIPFLNKEVVRDARLQEPGHPPHLETAEFDFAWLTAPGTAVFVAALLSMVMLRMNGTQIRAVVRRTVFQMRIPIPTIACMLGLSYVTRYAGMDATLGVAFAETGRLYPFFAPILGWLGVFLTGTDAGSNALFGSLQKITATQIHSPAAFPHLDLGQAQVLICTSNSTGGVMGKMIDAQSICVATAATHQLGREADIFKAVVWHSILLATIVGLITLAQAYVYPLTSMVPPP
jgi:lactate permease